FKFEHDFNDNLTLTNTFRLVRTTLDYIVTNPDDSLGNVDQGYVYRAMKSRDSTSEGWVNQTALRALFNTGAVAHTLVTGVEFSYEDIHNRPYAFSGNGSGDCSLGSANRINCTSLSDPSYKDAFVGNVAKGKAFTDTDTKTAGAYVFDTLKFNEQWSLNLGLRYDDFESRSSGYSNGSKTTGQPAGDFKFENHSNFLSYQTGLVFNPLPNGSIYLAWSTSTNPIGETSGSGSQDISFIAQDLKPERNRNTELGTKWDFFHERLRLEAALFKTTKSNARINDANGLPQNIGETQVRGFELGASGKLTDKWQMFASYTYLDSEIKKGPDQGNHVPSAPENTLSLWTTYSVLPDLTIGGGANYVDSRYGDTANTIQVPDYWRYDAMAAYRVSKNLDVQLNVQNLTDERYFDQVYSNHMAHVAPGRTYLLSTNFHF
ncbi:MAG TPA: TonB-dependent receptor, partial [Pseudomonas sp.]|nr:TonB-dependent receptor [Pseudomonas sp.]